MNWILALKSHIHTGERIEIENRLRRDGDTVAASEWNESVLVRTRDRRSARAAAVEE